MQDLAFYNFFERFIPRFSEFFDGKSYAVYSIYNYKDKNFIFTFEEVRYKIEVKTREVADGAWEYSSDTMIYQFIFTAFSNGHFFSFDLSSLDAYQFPAHSELKVQASVQLLLTCLFSQQQEMRDYFVKKEKEKKEFEQFYSKLEKMTGCSVKEGVLSFNVSSLSYEAILEICQLYQEKKN